MKRKIIAELLRPSLLAACLALICLQITDSVTGERLAASVDKREGGMALSSAVQCDAEALMDYCADKLTTRLGELKGEPKAG